MKKPSYLIGGTFNSVPPVLIDGDLTPFQTDSSGNLKVTFTGGSASNPAASPTGSAVPASASYTGVNVSGILQGVTGFSLNAGASIPAAVAIVDGNGNQITSFGGGTQYADSAASGGTPTGTLQMGWDSANSKIRALKVDASQNLEVVINAPLPAGTNVIGHVIVDSGAITVSGSVSVSNFPATQIVAGAKTPADAYANPTDAEDAFALLGGWDATAGKWQRVQVDTGTGTVKVDPGTVTVTGSVSVSNFPATQPVSGTVTANQGTAAALAGAWPVEVTDGTNVLGTSSHPLRVDPTGTTTQPVSGTVSVGNFPATQNVAGTTTDGTTTETNFLVVGGESNDATAQYQPIPLGAGGRSVIIEGVVGGTAVSISGSVSVSNFPATQPVSGTVTANQGTPNTVPNAWPVEVSALSGGVLTALTANNSSGSSVALDINIVRLGGISMTPQNGIPISDNNSNQVKVQPASTGAAAADNALTVSLSPNSPVSLLASGAAAKWTGLNLAGINPGHVVIVDSSGSGTVPAVKAASVAPLATDPALVVAISPNSTITTSAALPPNAAQENGGNLLVISELLKSLILETRGVRRAMVSMVTESGQFSDSDFDPNNLDFQPVV